MEALELTMEALRNAFYTHPVLLPIFIGVAIGVAVLPRILLGIDYMIGTHLSCGILGWHHASEEDSRSELDSTECTRCGTRIVRDRHGHWY